MSKARKKQASHTPADEIDAAFADIDKVLQPMTRGDGGDHRGCGGDKKVIAARVAVQGLHMLRQWARLGASVGQPKMEETANG